MKENYMYPVILEKMEKMEKELLVSFPDFPGQVTEAETEIDAIKAAQEVLALNLLHYEEDLKKEGPKASKAEDIELKEGQKLVFISVWMPYYRRLRKEVFVKKTLTIPQELNILAEQKGINFSRLLARALREELGIED